MGKFYDITGWKFGRLTVIKRVESLPKAQSTSRWLCQCECGNQRNINKNNLVNGHSTSCGCYALELRRGNNYREKHGQSRSRIYHTWQSMKQRCYDNNCEGFKHYGDRGISVCEEWLNFENFYKWAVSNGYKSNLTIERIDVDGDYEPNNCKWITVAEQNRNKTTTRYIELNGCKRCIGEWSKLLDIPINTIINRLNRGCNPEEALNTNYYKRINAVLTESKRIRLYREGVSDKQAATILGIKPVSYRAWRIKRGFCRGIETRPDAEIKSLLEAWDDTKTKAQA